MRFLHCSVAVVALLAAPLAAQGPAGGTRSDSYVVFMRGAAIGRENVTTRVDATGTTITSQGRMGAPVNSVLQHAELQYGPAGTAQRLTVEAVTAGVAATVRSSFKDGSVTTQASSQGKTGSTTQTVASGAVIIPGGVFGAFTALTPRLRSAAVGDQVPLFIIPDGEFAARVTAVRNERMQTGGSVFDVKRIELTIPGTGLDTTLDLTTASDDTLLRISIPGRGIDVLRQDIAGANTRTEVYSNPGEQQALVPALGFNLASTLTMPAAAATSAPPTLKLPAVVLVGDQEATNRDAVGAGAPAMAQLAGALASAGFMVIRYDNRGSGQSGGRPESASLADYADDARAVVKWVAARKDVDTKRIAMVGYGTGAWISLFAAAHDKKIAAVVTLAASSSTGDQFVLEQQRLQLAEARAAEPELAEKQALQKRVHAAVLTGKGWDKLPQGVQRNADTPWFHSFLTFDPSAVIGDIKAPILIVHGALDREVPVEHAERLAAAARKGDSTSVGVVTVRSTNHLLMPSETGSVGEYNTLSARDISTDLTGAVTAWLAKVLPAPVKK